MPRPQKSEFEHELAGTRPQTVPEKPSVFRAGRPQFPQHLTPVAKREFKRAVKLLEDRGVLTQGDYTTLSIYAEVFARWIQAKGEIHALGLMVEVEVTDNHGEAHIVRRLNPLLRVAQDCEKQLRALAKTLGLTPIDRDKVKQVAGAKTVETDPATVPGTVAYFEKHGTWGEE